MPRWLAVMAVLLAVIACSPSGSPIPAAPALAQVFEADASFRSGMADVLDAALADLTPADADVTIDPNFVVTTGSDGAVLANALLGDLSGFDGVASLLDRELLLAVHADAEGHTSAAVGRLTRIQVDGDSTWFFRWRGADGAVTSHPAIVQETERDAPFTAQKVKIRLTAKLKNPPEVNIEIEWGKDQNTRTGFARIVAPLPEQPTSVDPRDLAAAYRSTLTTVCCGRPKPGPVRPGGLAAATAPDLTVLAVPYQITGTTKPDDFIDRDIAFVLLDHRQKGPVGNVCVADDPSTWCRSAEDPFANLRLIGRNDGTAGFIARLTAPTDPTQVIAEGVAQVEPRAAGESSATTIDVDQTPDAIVITITIIVGDLKIVIRIEI